MTFVVSFEDFVPPARYDGAPWDSVFLYEGETSDGPWVAIDAFTLNPVDEDPTQPGPRSFTTQEATLEEGWYYFLFQDATGLQSQPTDSLHNTKPLGENFTPSLSDLGAKMLARTRDNLGNLLGTFTNDTVPDTAVAGECIESAVADIIENCGIIPDVDELVAAAENAAMWRAAMYVETSVFPEQFNTGRSAYPQYKENYEEALKSLQNKLEAYSIGDEGVPSHGNSYGSFPEVTTDWLTRKM